MSRETLACRRVSGSHDSIPRRALRLNRRCRVSAGAFLVRCGFGIAAVVLSPLWWSCCVLAGGVAFRGGIVVPLWAANRRLPVSRHFQESKESGNEQPSVGFGDPDEAGGAD